MSYTIVDDGPVIQVRASIETRAELQELIEKLTKRLDPTVWLFEPPKEEKSE